MKRREFIRSSALAAAATALAVPAFSFVDKKKVGLQLWTVRDILAKDVKGVLKQISDLGYKELEAFGYNDGKLFGLPSKEFSTLAGSMGMKLTSGHYGTGLTSPELKGTLSNDWERAVVDAKAAGQEYMILAYLQKDERKTLDDYRKVCGMLNKAGEVAKKNGVRMGYHNHNFEFEKIDGQIPYDLMLKELDPKLVSMELDLYWVYNAGYNPLDYFAKYPGRFEQWHIKDMDKTDRAKNADFGTGSIDFKPLFAKADQSGVKHFYIEHDTFPGTPMESVKADIENFKKIMG